jgi:hypothetical protein
MTVLNENMRRTAAFLISEEEAYRSREQVQVIPGASTTLDAGTILGKVTATGKYVQLDTSESDGSQTAAGILYESAAGVGASDEVKRTIIARDAQVIEGLLVYPSGLNASQTAAVTAELVGLGIIVRKEA